MKLYSLVEIVEAAQKNSSYFRGEFKNIDLKKFKNDQDLLQALPLTDHQKYWASHQFLENPLTTEEAHGILFKSGGSTGHPKFSYYASSEWDTFCKLFGWGIGQGILDDGDRVSNMFYAGDLYASFIFIKDSFQAVPKKFLQLPVGGGVTAKTLEQQLLEFKLTTLCGVPTAIIQLISELHEKNPACLKPLKKILYGGESMYLDQQEWLQSLLPGLQIASVGYASVDAGLLGYCARDCAIDEHRCFEPATLMEILDESTNEPITEINQPGRLFVTNLTRKLMPILRYPVGDRAVWIEPVGSKNRKFKILGRSEEGARVGTVTVDFEEVRLFLQQMLVSHPGFQFQMLLSHSAQKDQLELRISLLDQQNSEDFKKEIIREFHRQKPSFADAEKKGLVHPLKINFCDLQEFEKNARTGKLKRIIDSRKS